MGTISAKSLDASLEQARGVGIVEEKFTLGDCEVTLRNLRPSEYEAVLNACKDEDDLAYLNAFQIGHISRAIQELNGVSLRDVDFVECEEPDPKKPGQVRTIKREKHDWLQKNVLNTWGKEGIYNCYRKFSDVVTMAETKSRQGIVFLTPDETAEERFRRLTNELKELETEVPPALVVSILQESGYAPYTEPADRAALGKLDELSRGQESEAPSTATAPAEPETRTVQASDGLRNRVPLNQQVDVDAVPVPPTPPQAPTPSVSAPIVTPPPTPPQAVMSKRSADFLAQEAEFDEELRASLPVGVVPPGGVVAPEYARMANTPPERVAAVLDKPQRDHTDPQAFGAIIEKPPTGGLNPKFQRKV
jgi:hypothetical protein